MYGAWELHQSTAVIAATATGKTEIYMSLAVAEPGRVCVLVHRDYLIQQPIRRLAEVGFHDVAVEKADSRAETAGMYGHKAKIVFASVQSIGPKSQKARLDTFDAQDFSLLIIDEAHRATAETYLRVIDHFTKNPRLKVLILTATPNRKDGVALRNICDSVAGVYGPSKAMAEGWIVPVNFFRREVLSLDFSNVRLKGSDLDPDQVQALLMQEKPLHEVCSTLAEDRGSTIVFCPEVAIARAYEQLMNDRYRPGRSKMLCAESPEIERIEAMKRLEQGELDYIFNVGLFCLDALTEILTSDGWVGIDAMTFEHQVANWCEDGTIFFREPQAILRRQRFPGEKMVTLNGSRPGMDIRVTEKHRMVCRHGSIHGWKIEHAGELADKVREFPVCGEAEPLDIQPEQECRSVTPKKVNAIAYLLRGQGMCAVEAKQEASRRVRHRSDLRYANPTELTLDECELIGFWLGDGSVNNLRSGGKEYTVFQVAYQKNIVARIGYLIRSCGIHAIKRERINTAGNLFLTWHMPRGTGGGPQQRPGVYRIEPYLAKEGTELLWGLSREQILALLRGLWMADGSHNDDTTPPNGYKITGRRKGLFDLLQAIAVCRGLSAGITIKKPAQPHHSVLYFLAIHNRTVHRVGHHPMRIEQEPWKDERIWCVTSHTGNIITRRNGKVVVTGNTEGLDIPNLQRVVWAAPTASLVRFTQGTGRVFRVHGSIKNALRGGREDAAQRKLMIAQSPKPNGIVVTYYPQNCKHELCDPVDILGGEDLPEDIKQTTKMIQDETARQAGGSTTEEDIETARVFVSLAGVVDDRLSELKAKAEFTDAQFNPMSGRKNRTTTHTTDAVRQAAPDWPHGEPMSDAQYGWFQRKNIPLPTGMTKFRAVVVRDLIQYGIQPETAFGYGRKQAMAVRDSYRSKEES